MLFALTAGTALAMVAVPFIRRAAMYGIYVSDVTPQLLQVCGAALVVLRRDAARCRHARATEPSFVPGQALLDLARFMLLFSSIIPISLRVALDMAKLVYKVQMTSDARMPGLQASGLGRAMRRGRGGGRSVCPGVRMLQRSLAPRISRLS